jgi:hypothetical protein
MIISESLVIQVGTQILLNPAVQAAIKGVIVKGVTAVVAFITPYILPALAVIGVVLLAAVVAILTVKVAEWIMAELA